MDILIRKRGVAKSALTRIETYITILPDQNHADLTILDRRLKAFEQCRDDFLLAHQEICCQCDAADLPTHEQELDDFEARLDTVLSTLIDIKTASTPVPSPTLSAASGTSQPSTSATSQHATADIKLPKLELPTFTGDFQQWLSFHDLFTSTIHSNVKLSGAQKLQYLKASLRDEAAKLLQSMQITDANYAEAWDILTKRYQNKREIVESHLKKLFSQQTITTESAESLRKLLDSTTECIRSLKILGLPTQHWDTIFIHILTAKLDGESRKQWELSLKSDDLPTWDVFSTYLDQRARALAAVSIHTSKGTYYGQTQGKYSHHASSTTKGTTVHLGSTHTPVCPVCSTDHTIYRCPEFHNLSVSNRTQLVKDKHLCFNCLGRGHSITNCLSGTCRHCNKKHHTLLHIVNQQNTEQPVPVTTHVASNIAATQVLLSTLQLTIFDKFGKAHIVRALLDNAAQSSFISERCVQKCNLNKHRANVPITGLGAKEVGYSTSSTKCKLFNGNENTNIEVQALVVPVVTSIMPNCKVDHSNWDHIKYLKLADPTFGEPGPIDLLLGADVYSDIVCGPKLMGSKGQPAAMETIFGWVLNGKTTNGNNHPIRVHVAHCDVSENLQRFKELKETSSTNILTTEDKTCKNHFTANHTKDLTGRYHARLPFKSTKKPLEDSNAQDARRLKQLDSRLVHKPQLQEQDNDISPKGVQMGHTELIPTDKLYKAVNTTYYMPHHAVIQESSFSTKLRVIVDASATTSTSVALNKNLMGGHKLQDDISPTLIPFRMQPIAHTADIPRMYPQFRVKKEYCYYQHIGSTKSSDKPLKDYRLLTATFDVALASHLAVQCSQQLALDVRVNFQLATPVLQLDRHVDDLMTGANIQDEAINFQDQIINIIDKRQMELRIWSSNDPTPLKPLHHYFRKTELPITFDTDDSGTTLGLHSLQPQKPLLSKRETLKLGPFLYTKGKLRVGGRLNSTSCPLDSKHPMLLPRSHQPTSLIIQHYFQTLLNFGRQLLLISRYLAAMSTHSADLSAYTLGHFLFFVPPTSIPEPAYIVKENRFSRCEITSRLFQHFWQRRSRNYLYRFQQRPKCGSRKTNLKGGELVLIKDEDLPPSKWNLGRITELHPGKIGHIRVVRLKTKTTSSAIPIFNHRCYQLTPVSKLFRNRVFQGGRYVQPSINVLLMTNS